MSLWPEYPTGLGVFGPVGILETCEPVTLHSTVMWPGSVVNLDSIVKIFWNLEAVGMLPVNTGDYLTPDERQAGEYTQKCLRHNGTRFEVAIPWKDSRENPNIQANRVFAECRLTSLLRLLEKKYDIKTRYSRVLEEYLGKGYVRYVDPSKVSQCGLDQWFLPHFPVDRYGRATTKIRVAFVLFRYTDIRLCENCYSACGIVEYTLISGNKVRCTPECKRAFAN